MKHTTTLAAVATLLLAAACSDSGTTETGSSESAVKCHGINECKGQSECETADAKSACTGLNDCTGQGWITVDSLELCEEQGGIELEEAKKLYADGKLPPPVKPAADAGAGSEPPAGSVMCEGINECKGTSDCASADGSTSCKGMNDCKGHGWVYAPSAEDCTTDGGTVIVKA